MEGRGLLEVAQHLPRVPGCPTGGHHHLGRTMKRLTLVLLTCLLTAGMVLTTPLAAEARKKRDTPGCVTRAEYLAARPGATQSRVKSIFDTWGAVRFDNDHGYWVGDWVEDGYWV